jgi:L-lactate dehydrogenase complex protein LldG
MTRTDLFVERVRDYRASVTVCQAGEVPSAVAGLASQLVIPPGLPPEWIPSGITAHDGAALTAGELDQTGLSVLTGCAVAIAETGTIVLDAGPGQGRRLLTLVPDHHVCVVRAAQIVADVPGIFAVLTDPTRPLTFISGPSATSDIELNRVEGVHGPRRLDVIVIV